MPVAKGPYYKKIQQWMKKDPCLFQVRAVEGYQSGKHVIVVAPTGKGKTLPLVANVKARSSGITLIISALNVISHQIVEDLKAAGVYTVLLRGKDISDKDKKVLIFHFQRMNSPECRAIVTSPEGVCSVDFGLFLRSSTWSSRLNGFMVDEAHCVLLWSDWRDGYREFEFLRTMFSSLPWYLTTATLSPQDIKRLTRIFDLQPNETQIIRLSSKRPNLQIIRASMKHSSNSYEDLLYYLGPNPIQTPPSPFIVFMPSIKMCAEAGNILRSTLRKLDPDPLTNKFEDKISWISAVNTDTHMHQLIEGLASGRYWGVFATEKLCMGYNPTNLQMGGIYEIPKNPYTLVQQIGRFGRSTIDTATAIIWLPKERKRNGIASSAVPTVGTKRKIEESEEPMSKKQRLEDGVMLVDAEAGVGNEASSSEEDENDLLRIQPLHLEQASQPRKSKGKSKELDPDIERFMKATGCLHKFFDEIFDNSTCLDECYEDCVRCKRDSTIESKTTITLCCSNCHPELLRLLDTRITLVPATQRKKAPMKIPEAEEHVKLELLDWARATAAADFGVCGALLLGDELASQMARLARAGYLASISDLSFETDWVWIEDYGEEILRMLWKFYPREHQKKAMTLRGIKIKSEPVEVKIESQDPPDVLFPPSQLIPSTSTAGTKASDTKDRCAWCRRKKIKGNHWAKDCQDLTDRVACNEPEAVKFDADRVKKAQQDAALRSRKKENRNMQSQLQQSQPLPSTVVNIPIQNAPLDEGSS